MADARTFRFASPEGKRMTGKMKRMAVRFRSSPFATPSRPRRAPWSAPRAREQSGRTCHGAVPALSGSAAFRPTPALRPLVGQVRTFSVPHYFAPPTYRDMPTYEPLVRCERFSALAWVAHEDDEDPCQRRLGLGLTLKP